MSNNGVNKIHLLLVAIVKEKVTDATSKMHSLAYMATDSRRTLKNNNNI